MTEELDKKERELLNYANNTPMVLSLLYDIDMLPEQVSTEAGGWEKRRTREWFKMLMIISTIKIAVDGDGASQQSGSSSTTAEVIDAKITEIQGHIDQALRPGGAIWMIEQKALHKLEKRLFMRNDPELRELVVAVVGRARRTKSGACSPTDEMCHGAAAKKL